MNNLPLVHNSGQNQTAVLFEQRAIVELSQDEMLDIDGGTTPLCLVGAGVGIVWTSVQIGKALYHAIND